MGINATDIDWDNPEDVLDFRIEREASNLHLALQVDPSPAVEYLCEAAGEHETLLPNFFQAFAQYHQALAAAQGLEPFARTVAITTARARFATESLHFAEETVASLAETRVKKIWNLDHS